MELLHANGPPGVTLKPRVRYNCDMNRAGPSAEDNERNYRAQILDYGQGNRSLADLPVEDDGFWADAFRVAARPGRTSDKAPFIGAAAEQLLRTRLTGAGSQARDAAAIALLEDSNPRVRRIAIGRVAQGNPRANHETLRRVVLGSDKEVAVEALHIVARQPSSAAHGLLADVLVHTSDFRASIASSELIRAGAAAIPSLEALLDSTDRNVRWRAVSTIVAIDGRESLGCLMRALHDDSVDIAWLAADGLLKLGQPVQVDVLRSVLKQHISVATARALRHYAEHSSPRRTFKPILDATQGLASLSAIPAAIEAVLITLEKPGS